MWRALFSVALLAACAHSDELAVTKQDCEGQSRCVARGVLEARDGSAPMGVLTFADGTCINVSLPPQYVSRLRREGPHEATVDAEVWPDPSAEGIEIRAVDGREVSLGRCGGDFYLFAEDYDVQIH
jgi:hypothetical protein